MSQNKEDVYMVESNNRIQTRRASRSARSASPVMEEEEEELTQVTNGSLIANGSRVTRSQSVESSGYETTDSRKRKRKAKNSSPSNKKRVELDSKATPPPPPQVASATTMSSNLQNGSHLNGEGERETRNTAQRISKEAREAKKVQRDLVIKERLSELDKLEKAVKDGSHSEYHKLLSDIESKRSKMLSVAEMRRSLAEGNVSNFFKSQKYAAYSQFYWDKLSLRRSMIQQVQHKINTLEQEYYSNHVQSSLDDDHLSEWVPPDRPSMISSLTLGLTEDDAENDIEWAKQDPAADEPIYTTSNQKQRYPNKSPPPPTITTTTTTYFPHDQSTRDSPPLEMLASLADHQHEKDFKQEQTEKSFTLPPLNPWRYSQRPSLPT